MHTISKTCLQFLLALACACVASASLAAQRIWKVFHGGGPGVDFLDLPPAVAAASAGDVIWVYGDPRVGVFYYTAPTIDKPLTVSGFGIVPSGIGSPNPTNALLRGLLTITNIPAGSRVVISDMVLVPFPPPLPIPSPLPPHGVVIRDCQGEVVLENILFRSNFFNVAFEIERSANVTLRGSNVYLGGIPIAVTDSTLLLSNTWLQAWFYPFPSSYNTSTEMLRLIRSNVTMVVCTMYPAGDGSTMPGGRLRARRGAILEGSTLTIGPGTTLRGGEYIGGLDPWGQPLWVLSEAYTTLPPLSSQVLVDPRGAHSGYTTGSTPPQPTWAHASVHRYIVAGEDYLHSACGPPNGFAILAAGSKAITPIPTGHGLLAIDPPSLVVLGAVPLDQYGWHHITLRCPPYVPSSWQFAFQAAVLSPQGDISLTVPSPFTVGWQHGRIP
jgi:hypothetical protein